MKRLGGWWRLWIVMTVLWGIGVGGFGSIMWKGSRDHHLVTDEDMKRLRESSRNLLAGPWDRYQEGRNLVEAANPPPPPGFSQVFGANDIIVVKLGAGQQVDLKPGSTTEQIKRFQEDFARVREAVLWREFRQHFFYVFLTWILPSLLVVAMAQTGRWVLTGFRSPPTPATVVNPPEQNTDSRT